MLKNVITFDESAKEAILDIFGKAVDKEGYIVEKDKTKQKVLSPDGEYVKLDQFAGLKKGSLLFIKKDLPSLIELADQVK